jgi:hypothetical protein
MDNGHKQKLIVAGLAALALGAGSYFTLSGKSAPPAEPLKEKVLVKSPRPQALSVKKPRHRRAPTPNKTAAPQRNFRQRQERPKQERERRERGKKPPTKRNVKDLRGA